MDDFLRFVRANVVWAWQSLGYVIRPYDMLADRRRWRWQPAQRCGAPPEVIAEALAYLNRRAEEPDRVFPTRAEWVERTERSELERTLVEVERMRPVLEAAQALADHRRTDADPADATDALLAAVDVYNQPPSTPKGDDE